jgi:CPA2 family monovalent cation:H+ antiporter-2
VFLLLFSVGLEFSLADLARLGWRLPIGGSLQMLLVALPVAGWLTAAGLGIRAAILVGLAVSFSSTVLVFQSLAEWGKSGTPHGRRAIGILLFQDAALIPILLLIPMITGDADSAPGLGAYFRLGLTSVAFVAGVIVLRELLPRWVMPLLLIDRSVAPAVLFTCVVLGGMTFAAYRAGLPPVVGAFAAGLILSGNRWTAQVDALALPFRETFATVFFVSLGLLLDPAVLWREWRTVGAAVVAVLALKAVAGIIALRGTGLAWRSSLGMGFGLAPVGEFAFILLLAGHQANLLSGRSYEILMAVGLLTLMMTPVLLRKGLEMIHESASDSGEPRGALAEWDEAIAEAVVIGAGPVGRRVASELETTGHDVCLVDRSPVNLYPFAALGFRTVGGDAADPVTLERARAASARIVVVCVPQDDASLIITRSLRHVNTTCRILVRCRFRASVAGLEKAGADQVVNEESQVSEALARVLPELLR